MKELHYNFVQGGAGGIQRTIKAYPPGSDFCKLINWISSDVVLADCNEIDKMFQK